MIFWLSADIFQYYFFQNILSVITSECQTVWIQIRPDILSGPDLGSNCLQKLSSDDKFTFFCVLMLFIPVNSFSVMAGQFLVFLGGTSTKQQIKCLSQGHKVSFSRTQGSDSMVSLKLQPFDPV